MLMPALIAVFLLGLCCGALILALCVVGKSGDTLVITDANEEEVLP